MAPFTAGQWRRGFRFWHNAHFCMTNPYRIIAVMARMYFYIKVEVDLKEGEKPDRVGSEICRVVQKIYSVRGAEVTNFVTRGEE